MVLMMVALKKWSLNSLDIKTAFLQGKVFDGDAFVIPPSEASVEQGKIWKLNKCVYSLTDASRVVFDSENGVDKIWNESIFAR